MNPEPMIRRSSAPEVAVLVVGEPGLATGLVTHHRHDPVRHRFTYDVTQIWIDPDRPGDLFDHHPLWSHRRPAPVRFRRRDYLDGGHGPLGPTIRRALAPVLGRQPTGALRTLTQPRVWGWLFNPLTLHLAWDGDGTDTDPVAALLEVTNTPWKERHLYPVALDRRGDQLVSRFAKQLHVSPFLDENQIYELRLRGGARGRNITMALNVHPTPSPSRTSTPAPDPVVELVEPILETHLALRVAGPDREAMTSILRPDRLPTHRVSFGIHRQALALWRKRVPFVAHPGRRS